MTSKKTLYDMLGVRPDATFAEIEAAYAEASRKLDMNTSDFTAESRDLEAKVLKMAFQTLSNGKSRQAYDARLNPRPSVADIPPAAPPETLSLHAEAVALKADAASLMAEAAVLKASAVSFEIDATPKRVAALVAKGVRATFTALGAVVALIFAFFFALYWVSSSSRQSADEEDKARERVMIQEYYQTHGVRPRSKIELDLLEAENRKRAEAKRQEYREKQEAENKERAYQRWVEDSRRQAEQISENLRQAKERAEREERYAAEKARMEQRMKEEAERMRIENERRKLGLR